MSESGDFSPGTWAGYDFKEERRKYDTHVGRSYSEATTQQTKAHDLLPKTLSSLSESPVVVVLDHSGSVGKAPVTIRSKLGYLDIEGREYLGPSMEVCAAAIGDILSDQYAFQAQPFATGTEMMGSFDKLVFEKNGGDGTSESYEIAALYFARQVSITAATKPIIIFIGDEKPYDRVTKENARRFAHVTLKKASITTEEIFEELKAKFAVYFIQLPYRQETTDHSSDVDREVWERWVELVGKDHVAQLADANRVVDVFFGIFAKETGRVAYFNDELRGRQKSEQVKTVHTALTTIHHGKAPLPPRTKTVYAKSTMHPKSKHK